MVKKTIKIPVYFGTITIVQVESLQEIERLYKLDSLHGVEACAFRNHKENGYARYVIAFEKKTNSRIISHEAFHVINLIYEDRGVIIETHNDEPHCYFLGWLVGECHKFLEIDNTKL